MSTYQTFELRDFALQRGETLSRAVLAYQTYGKLNADCSNCILYPTSYAAHHSDIEWLIGPERILDSSRYFIVCVNMFGNGLSSSPSDLPAPLADRFDLFTHVDNVCAQRQLLQEVFKVEKLALAYGWSMGAQQALHWGAIYPDCVERIAAICGSAKTTPHNFVFLEGLRTTLMADRAWDGERFTSKPERGLRAFGRVYAGWAMSQAFYRQHLYRTLDFASLEDFLIRDWEASFLRRDAGNLLSMLTTWQRSDISDNPKHQGDIGAALRSIRAKTLIMPSQTDLYFTPTDSELEADQFPGLGTSPFRRFGDTEPATQPDTPRTNNLFAPPFRSCYNMKVMSSPLVQLAQERGIKQFLVSFSDLTGAVRAKLVPASAIGQACLDGAGFAGFATWLDMTPADPDIFAIPDDASVIQLPWKPEVAWVASDLWMEGQPLPQAPRQVLKTAIGRARALGYELCTGVECEFFVLSPDGASLADGEDRQLKPCYDQQSLMRRYDLIAEISEAMELLGWNPYQTDHEDANGQFEMNWQYSDALTTADRHTFFKYMVKTLAERHGLRATFMPKPFSHLTGNGCHIHLSLRDCETKANRFWDAEGELGLSREAYSFLGGILQSASALCAFTNPSVNSYRRINAPTTTSGATWSPNTISYAGNNRTHMIRIPAPGRIELRLPDGAANPYLLPAAVLHAGLDGMEAGCQPGRRFDNNMYTSGGQPDAPPTLPDNLLESIHALQAAPKLGSALGERFTAAYLKLKQGEWRSYSSQISSWELASTLDC